MTSVLDGAMILAPSGQYPGGLVAVSNTARRGAYDARVLLQLSIQRGVSEGRPSSA